jgi:tRNA(fMet)-specific endonuclease VapC
MEMKILLDTNAYVALRKGEPEVAAVVRSSEELVFSMVVVAELLFGFRNGSRYQKNLAELEDFLDQPPVSLQQVTWVTADRFGRVAAALKRVGKPIPSNDIWIAAQTFETGAELVTFDTHFQHVAGLPLRLLAASTA